MTHIYTASQGRKDMKPPQPAPAGPTKQITYQQYSYLTDRQQSRKSEAAQTASSSSSSLNTGWASNTKHMELVVRKAETHRHQFLILHRNDTIVSQLQIPDGECSVATELHVPSTDPVLEQSVLKRCCLLSGEKK